MVQFCPNCKSLMYPSADDNTTWICKTCNYQSKRDLSERSVITIEARGKVDLMKGEVISSDESSGSGGGGARTEANCPECGHNEAYWHLIQIRAADEAPTRIYRCVKCSHTWRESD